jgi:hypothetical protein
MRPKNFFATLLISLTVAVSLLGGGARPVSAKRWVPPPAPTVLIVPPPGPKELGAPLTFFALLRDAKNNPLVDFSVDYYVDFEYFGQARTDGTGTAVYQTNKKLAAGEHVLSVRYIGNKEFLPSSATNRLVVKPSLVQVLTVPSTPGVTLNMDGRSFETGPDGAVEIPIYAVGRYSLSVNTDKFYDPNKRIEFGRWEAEFFQPFRDVDVPTADPIQVGLNVFHKAGQTFVDLDGNPVDEKRISKITIKSIQGDVFSYPDGQERWVPYSRTARRENGLEATPLQYSVMNVTVDGSNVVNQAQQRFFAEPDKVWEISLLLYSLRISTHDSLFGSPVGKAVEVVYPNGEVQKFPLDAAGTVQIHSLARGIYHIRVLGTDGMASSTPVALSRNQEAVVQVITNRDMATAGGAGLAVVIGLLLIGRPWLLLPWLRRRRNARLKNAPEPQPEAEDYVSVHNN